MLYVRHPGGSTTESYSYDAVGNRTASLGVSSYTTNASNEMTANSNAPYTYDSNGNTLTKVVGSNTTSYIWDYELRQAFHNGDCVIWYSREWLRVNRLSTAGQRDS